MGSQWKKGHSGNLKGRPRKVKPSPLDIKNLMLQALSKNVTLTQGNGTTETTMLEAGLQQWAVQFAKGDTKARRDLFYLAEKVGLDLKGETVSSDGPSLESLKILNDFFARSTSGTSSVQRVLAPPELRDDDSQEEVE